ncbi:MAG: hypothetical protein ABIK96_09100 [bacterium]
MSKNRGFSFRVHHRERVGIGLERTGPAAWKVVELTADRGDGFLPQGFLRGAGISRDRLTWVAPCDETRLLQLSLPPLKGKELNHAIKGWVARQENTTIEDVAVSYLSLGVARDQGGESRQEVVTLAMSVKDRQGHLTQAQAWDLHPGRMLPGYMVLDQFLRLVQPEGEKLEGWTLVYLGEQENFLTIANARSVLLHRGLPLDHSGGQDREQFFARLATEIERSRFFVRQGSQSADIQKVLVCGDPEQATLLTATLNAEGSVPAVHWEAEKHFSQGEDSPDTRHLVALAAAALSLEKPVFNLVSPARRGLLGRQGRRRALVAAGTLAAGVVPLLVVGSMVTSRIQAGYLEKAQARLETAKAEASAAAEVYKAHRLLTAKEACLEWKSRARTDLEGMLLELAAATPGPVLFRDLRVWEAVDGDIRMQLVGEAAGASAGQAQQSYLEFQDNLRRGDFLKGFQEPKVLEIRAMTQRGETTPKTMFTLELTLARKKGEAG